jgi:hypothetical protein
MNFEKPAENLEVNPGDDVELSGTVTGLNGRELWIVSRATHADQLYYIIVPSPTTKRDGHWGPLTDEDPAAEDDRGHEILFIGVVANKECSAFLASVPSDVKGVRSFASLPADCQPIEPPRVIKVPQQATA